MVKQKRWYEAVDHDTTEMTYHATYHNAQENNL